MAPGDDTPADSMSSQPFIWVIIPLMAIFAIGAIICFIWNRRRRRQNPDRYIWPENRVLVNGQYVRYRRGGLRWSPWGEARSLEGLNELGEAPPPYDKKKPPGIHEQHGPGVDGQQQGQELRDIEAGVLPPEYPTAPPPAVTRNS